MYNLLFLFYTNGLCGWFIIIRLSIEITSDQHQRLKAATALKGESIKNYMLKPKKIS
ncbi:hypothetical protein [sulfur-oxidizing endosymbiont of Gigantopelta aegis]|uniref:hypothetical protein n=1 Tax=sulfur-oxidizing endosymbiont of Gigantopelta aegis TaxID=2794934 RepID=UPI003CCCDAF6